eukprot:jgi/Ulvmu1/7573/UM037_0117.1
MLYSKSLFHMACMPHMRTRGLYTSVQYANRGQSDTPVALLHVGRLCRRRRIPATRASSSIAVPQVAPVEPVTTAQLSLYDTMDKKQRIFGPIETGTVSMYVCGVTVYDYSHIGHARVYVAFDVLYRVLRRLGYEVMYVRNFTDIDDKIIARAADTGEDPHALSARFIEEFHTDMATLGCLPPALEPKATDHINDMVSSIETIISNGYAYAVDGGDVFFDVQALDGYGKLSRHDVSKSKAGGGNRVTADERKKHPADFALWKSAKPGEPSWPSPWGNGRPGWHIECSAMIHKLMGHVIDIHGGGQDLMFPHHENEIAQSRAACCGGDHGDEHDRFARFWLHNGVVKINEEKMSKSLGNFFTIRDVLKEYHGMALRWFLVGTQYRQPITYSTAALDEASARLYYVYDTLRAAKVMIEQAGEQDLLEAARVELYDGHAAQAAASVRTALLDDLNTPNAVAALSEPLKVMNELLVVRKKKKVEDRILKLAALAALLQDSLELLGIDATNPDAQIDKLRELALVRAGLTEEVIQQAIVARAEARKAKDFERADAIRQEFSSKGVSFQDLPAGTTWRPTLRE